MSRRGRVSHAGGAADGARRSTRSRPARSRSIRTRLSGLRSAWSSPAWSRAAWSSPAWSRAAWSRAGWSRAPWSRAGWSRAAWSRAGWLRAGWSRAAWFRSAPFRRSAPVFALALVAVLAGCTAEATTAPGPQQTPSPFQDCATLSGGNGAPADLPRLTLPCFTGGAAVPLTALRGPAVINIWATWCDACRVELPAMQRLADRTKGRLRVIGVDTGDSRDAAASFGTDKRVTLPTLYDVQRKLVGALGRTALPVTVFLDAHGKRFVYNQLPPDEAQLAALVRTHTGVTVTG